MILDASTLEQVAAVDRIVAASSARALPGRLKTELFASVVETNTDVCAIASAEVDAALAGAAPRGRRRGAREGLALAAAGDASVRATRRRSRSSTSSATSSFVALRRHHRAAAGRAGAARPRRDAVGRGLLALPRARSCRGCRSCSRSRRTRRGSAGELHRDGVEPRARARRAAARGRARRRSRRTPSGRRGSSGSCGSASPQDYTRLWWDVRPHPTLGTLEVRMPDQPTAVGLVAAFAALLQALCATALAGGLPSAARCSPTAAAPTTRRTAGPPRASGRAPSCSTRTARRSRRAAELGAELLELVRPAARALGGERAARRGSTRRRARPTCSSLRTALEAAADLVARSLA